jgi:acyl carrier protein
LTTYGLDSLDVVEFVLDVEDKYGISFEAEETKDIKTVGELINLICSKVK